MSLADGSVEGVALPVLLRAARHAYVSAVRQALDDAGCDDVPSNGSYVIGSMANRGVPLSEIVRELRVSKQATGQLVDTLVARGYLDRSVDAEDRRRLNISLTERGRAAAAVVRSAIEGVDVALERRVGQEFIEHARVVLAALVGLYDPLVEETV